MYLFSLEGHLFLRSAFFCVGFGQIIVIHGKKIADQAMVRVRHGVRSRDHSNSFCPAFGVNTECLHRVQTSLRCENVKNGIFQTVHKVHPDMNCSSDVRLELTKHVNTAVAPSMFKPVDTPAFRGMK